MPTKAALLTLVVNSAKKIYLFYFFALSFLFLNSTLQVPIHDLRAGAEVQIDEDKERDPAYPSDDQFVFKMVGERCAARCVILHIVGRRFAAGQAMEIKISLIVIGSTQIFTFLQCLENQESCSQSISNIIF